MRPGHEDDDPLLVEPTHRRIEGFESRPAPKIDESPSRASKKVVEHEDATIKLGGKRWGPIRHINTQWTSVAML